MMRHVPEVTYPGWSPTLPESGGGATAREVANQAARLLLSTATAKGAAVVDLDTEFIWMLVEGGNPATAGDWKMIGRRSVRFMGVVANQAAMLAFAAKKGDWCHRSDLKKRFDFTGSDPANVAHWTASLTLAVADIEGLPYEFEGIHNTLGQKTDIDIAVTYGGAVVDKPANQIAGVSRNIGLTRWSDTDPVSHPFCDFSLVGVLGWAGLNPNTTWRPHHEWRNDRPMWHRDEHASGYYIYRSATGFWEIELNFVVAYRSTIAWLEYPWLVEAWTTLAGHSGVPYMDVVGLLRQFVPPFLLPKERVIAVVDAASVTLDFDAAKIFDWTLGGNRTLANPINVTPGTYLVRVKQDGAGGRTLAYGSNFRFIYGDAPELSAEGGAVDLLTIANYGDDHLYVVSTPNLQAAAE